MHEVSVMSSILENVQVELQKHHYDKVEELVLVVGELTYLGKDQLEFAYEILTRNTPLEGSRLVVEDEKVEIMCDACGYSGPVDYMGDEWGQNNVPKLICPKCNSNVKVIKGKSCRITSVKVVEE
jgi:hydrogenase nickel incorporation protein HypA/HybF